MKTTVEPIVYSQQDAAKALKIDQGIVLEKLHSGEIPGHREGRNWKIPKTLLQKWIEDVAIQEAKERRAQKGESA